MKKLLTIAAILLMASLSASCQDIILQERNQDSVLTIVGQMKAIDSVVCEITIITSRLAAAKALADRIPARKDSYFKVGKLINRIEYNKNGKKKYYLNGLYISTKISDVRTAIKNQITDKLGLEKVILPDPIPLLKPIRKT